MVCSICGRKLKDPKSRELGYGPVCYQKTFGCSMRAKGATGASVGIDDYPEYHIPGQMSLEDFLTDEVN